jgi:hypothetical protein
VDNVDQMNLDNISMAIALLLLFLGNEDQMSLDNISMVLVLFAL